MFYISEEESSEGSLYEGSAEEEEEEEDDDEDGDGDNDADKPNSKAQGMNSFHFWIQISSRDRSRLNPLFIKTNQTNFIL